MDDMGNSKIDSLDIEFPDGIKISMAKNKNNTITKKIEGENEKTVLINNGLDTPNETSNIEQEDLDEEKYFLIKSPMVGTFYSRSSPEKEPYVKVGDVIKKGNSLCIIEAMKLMNEIESECDGEIVEVCIEDEQMVEYGQILFKIKADT